MSLLDCITLYKVRNSVYVLFYVGSKRLQKHYDVMAPDGTIICSNVHYEKAVAVCQMHHVKTTPRPRRRSKIKTKKTVLCDGAYLNRGNDYLTDKTNLGDYADWSFTQDTDIYKHIKGM